MARMCVAWAIVWSVVALVPGHESFLIATTIRSLAVVLAAMAMPVQVTGTQVAAFGANVQVVMDCTSLAPTLLLIGAILAGPVNWSWRLIGAMVGVVLLWVYNVARLIVLMVVLGRWPRWFDLVHVYLWQSITLALVAALYVMWLRRAPRIAKP